MGSELTLPADLRAALIETLSDPLRAQVYIAVADRPGVTIAQIATRIGESARRVRHQIEWLSAAGLVVVDSETARRNMRERHYRALHLPRIEEDEGPWIAEERRGIILSITRQILGDVGRAIRGRAFGEHPGHSAVRVPGEVDGRGREEVEAIVIESTVRLEEAMVRSAERLEAAGEAGTEVIAALLLFESSPWENEEDRGGPRASPWLERARRRLSR
jgi:DNA-binding transcriptional ArsR family regulator